MMSDEIHWSYHSEFFTFLFKTWDVAAAKAIIREEPRVVECIDVSDLAKFIGTSTRVGVLISRERVENDDRIDLMVPLVAVVTPKGNGLVIDGWHRVAKAVALGVSTLPVVWLNAGESARVRLT